MYNKSNLLLSPIKGPLKEYLTNNVISILVVNRIESGKTITIRFIIPVPATQNNITVDSGSRITLSDINIDSTSLTSPILSITDGTLRKTFNYGDLKSFKSPMILYNGTTINVSESPVRTPVISPTNVPVTTPVTTPVNKIPSAPEPEPVKTLSKKASYSILGLVFLLVIVGAFFLLRKHKPKSTSIAVGFGKRRRRRR
jgi:hypothetical protein